MSEHFNKLTPAEAERIALLMEECGEVVQICGKILRHGFESRHPTGTTTNRTELAKELGDVEAAVLIMNNTGDIADCMVKGNAMLKLGKVHHYMHHQPDFAFDKPQ